MKENQKQDPNQDRTQKLLALLENQLEPKEVVLWTGQPDASNLVGRLLMGAVLVLSSIYMESVSQLYCDYSVDLLTFRASALGLVTAIAVFLIVRAPKRAQEVLYVLTDRRVFRLDGNKNAHPALRARYKDSKKQMLAEYPNSSDCFWLTAFCHTFVITTWMALFLPTIVENFDIFMAFSALFLVLAGLGFLYEKRYLPDARLRDLGGVLYSMNGKLVFVQSLKLSDVSAFTVRRRPGGCSDMFLVSNEHGCLRMPAVACSRGPETVRTNLAAVGGLPVQGAAE